MLAGSPVSPERSAWFYRNVKRDLWLHSGSGGTDVLHAGSSAACPTLPVYAGEHPGPQPRRGRLRVRRARARPVVGEVGEMVITQPMPSMPVSFWERRRRRALPRDLLPDYPRRLAARRLLPRQRARRLLRARPLRRDAEPARRADRHRRDLPGRSKPSPEIADALMVNLDLPGGRVLHAAVRHAGQGARYRSTRPSRQRIRTGCAREYSPRHVPDKIIEVPGIPPRSPARRWRCRSAGSSRGTPVDAAVDRESMANPEVLEAFVAYAASRSASPEGGTTGPDVTGRILTCLLPGVRQPAKEHTT